MKRITTTTAVLAAITLSIVLQGCRSTPSAAAAGSPNDALYSEQRTKRQDYSETETINACSEDSGSCYSLVADLEHHFDSQGRETVFVEQIHFPNGGHLSFGGATIPGGGTDTKGRAWTFAW